MSCSDDFITVIQGEERELKLRIADPDGAPRPLNTPDEIKARFQNADGSVLEKDLSDGITILNDARGEIQVALVEADTDALMVGERLDFVVELVNGAVTRKVIFKRALTIVAEPF